MKLEMLYRKTVLFYVYSIMLLFLITLFLFTNEKDSLLPSIEIKSNRFGSSSTNAKNGSILDGCYHVFIDVGSNIGVQIRKLFEPNKLPNSKLHTIFNANFGTIRERRIAGFQRNRVVCAIGIEPNSHHTQYLKRVEKGYNKCGWKVMFLTETAVSDHAGQTRFFTDEAYEYMEWGGGILPPSINKASMDVVKNRRKPKYNNVTLIKLSEFLDKVVGKRMLPIKSSKYHPPRVVIKMDIEGSEVDVLSDLIFRGGLQYVNIMMIEWHPRLEKLDIRRDAQKSLQDLFDHLSQYSQKMRKNMKTRFDFDFQALDIDDESYYDAKFKIPDCSNPNDYILD